MGKLLLTLLLTLSIFIPTSSFAEAADVPDIRQISSDIKPEFSGFSDNCYIYFYESKNGNALNYAKQFVQMLTRNYPFKVNFSYIDDYYGGEWALIYTGTKRVAKSDLIKDGNGNYSQIYISTTPNLISTLNKEIEITIVKGLDYAGHFVKEDSDYL